MTCTTSSVAGDVGLANVGAIANTGCTIAGATEEGIAAAQAATLTDSVFVGNVLAGESIAVTRGQLTGQVLAGGIGTTVVRTGAVTLTDTAVDFCPTLTPPPQPPLLPVFVIGVLEPHAVGDVVNFWDTQWWAHNAMSGLTSSGTASFKGFATSATLLCSGAWESLPGSSAPPHATIDDDIAVIVTSTVVKPGPKLIGDVQ